jgi:hypothetical protein
MRKRGACVCVCGSACVRAEAELTRTMHCDIAEDDASTITSIAPN